MIPAPLWVDGWGRLYEMVLSGRCLPTTRAASPWGATSWAWGDRDGQCGLPWPCSPCAQEVSPRLLRLRASSGMTGVLGLINRALLCLLPSVVTWGSAEGATPTPHGLCEDKGTIIREQLLPHYI